MIGKPLVSNLSVAFKKATAITEDVELAKKEHRTGLKTLIDRYYVDVQQGKAEGIRNAKELAEIMKLDLLLMGEATDRTITEGSVDQVQMQNIQNSLDPDSPEVQALINQLFGALNNANDGLDNRVKPKVVDIPKADVEIENDTAQE